MRRIKKSNRFDNMIIEERIKTIFIGINLCLKAF
jgi:hypothetical protein